MGIGIGKSISKGIGIGVGIGIGIGVRLRIGVCLNVVYICTCICICRCLGLCLARDLLCQVLPRGVSFETGLLLPNNKKSTSDTKKDKSLPFIEEGQRPMRPKHSTTQTPAYKNLRHVEMANHLLQQPEAFGLPNGIWSKPC